MDEVILRDQQLQQIESQVAAGLPPAGPQIISQEPAPTGLKNILINILLALGIISLGTLSVVLLVLPKPISKTAQISPPQNEQAVVTLTTKYANPFDKSTQYTNPFSENANPFSDISQ